MYFSCSIGSLALKTRVLQGVCPPVPSIPPALACALPIRCTPISLQLVHRLPSLVQAA